MSEHEQKVIQIANETWTTLLAKVIEAIPETTPNFLQLRWIEVGRIINSMFAEHYLKAMNDTSKTLAATKEQLEPKTEETEKKELQ